MSPTRRQRQPLHLYWSVALMPSPSPQLETGRMTRHRQCPPRLPRLFFLHDFAPPPPAIVRPWPHQRRWCGIPTFIRFDVIIVVVIVVVVIQGLDILCCGHCRLSRCVVASLVALPSLSSHRRHVATTIATSTPVSLCLFPTSGWLLHCHLSCRASASLAAPVPLLSCHRLSRCTAASLVVPNLHRLVVASPTILTCHRLSCHTGWLLPCYLSLCAAVSLFTTSLSAPLSL